MGSEFRKFVNNDDLAGNTRDNILLEAAIKFEAQAVALAPVDTGRLRSSIGYNKDGDSYLVGTNVDYAIHQEFGTKNMPAQAFLRPTAEIMKNKNLTLNDLQKYLRSIGSK